MYVDMFWVVAEYVPTPLSVHFTMIKKLRNQIQWFALDRAQCCAVPVLGRREWS